MIKRVMKWVKASISLFATQWTQISDHKTETMSKRDVEIGHIGNEIDTTNRKEGSTRWYDDDVGSSTISLSALSNEKGSFAKLGLLYEEAHFFVM